MGLMNLLTSLKLRRNWEQIAATLPDSPSTLDTVVEPDSEVGLATREVTKYNGRKVVPVTTHSLGESRYSRQELEVTYKVGSLTPEALAKYNARNPNQPFEVTDIDITQCGKIEHRTLERNGAKFRVLSFRGDHTVMGVVIGYELRVEDRTYKDGVEVPTRVSVIETYRPFPERARNPEGRTYNLHEEVTRIVQERLGGGAVRYGSK